MKNLNNAPLISILIPCHNIEKRNIFSLNYLLKNNLSNCEILLLNDYSSDKTLEILNKYKSENKDIEIRVIDLSQIHPHVGPGFNSDLLIKEAKGKYVFFLDDDDMINKNAMNELKKVIMSKEYDIISTKTTFAYNFWKKLRIPLPKVPEYKNYDKQDNLKYFIYNPRFRWGLLIRRQFYLDVCNKYSDSFSGSIYEDIRFMFYLYLSKPRFLYLDKKTITYVIRKNSLSTNVEKISKKLELLFEAYEKMTQKIEQFQLLEQADIDLSKYASFVEINLVCLALLRIIPKDEKKEFIKLIRQKISENYANIKFKSIIANMKLPTKIMFNMGIKKFIK
ncbi:glycosyltransferase family 2 protein [Mycoplasmopsis caviae]|uniref:Glycosyltransferase family 2 protein n=1 Tax=Mycoplasmopsis caviae TaxID=55603 RepID=A0A3P8KBW9_9BACT|nr:glycosyltransferase family A protein [Mycoplasmopsis caviae]UUD35086.1 glycosyltransferase family 2 protein [Mycoplasmopsis caviae]VDR42094.1 Poly-beta-1,6-N-acetyl-D-glucosamine synthase [Mycoplasmopsis caviae]